MNYNYMISIWKRKFVLLFIFSYSTALFANAQEGVKEDTEVSKDEKEVFLIVDELPEFPGGQDEMIRFMIQNTKYPKQARAKNITGIVMVNFKVDSLGNICNPIVVKNVHPLLDKEALRVVKLMPKWKPGKLKGVPVSVNYMLPFRFSLRYEDK